MKSNIVLSLFLLLLISSCSGKDTVFEFSDPNIQLLKGYDDGRQIQSLFISSTQTTVEINVFDYLEENGSVYAIGEQGFTILNIKTKEYKQSKKVDDFSTKDKEILKRLKRT
jgi:hypothetical protein